MKHLRVYESYFANSFTIEFAEETMNYAFWDVYYPIASKNDHYPTMQFKDYIGAILDSLCGEIIDALPKPHFMPRYTKKLENLNIDVDSFTIKIPSNGEINDETMDIIDNFLRERAHEFMDNRFKKMPEVKYRLYIDNTMIKDFGQEDFNYSKLDKKFLQELIDRALDEKDFKRAEKLGKYLKL